MLLGCWLHLTAWDLQHELQSCDPLMSALIGRRCQPASCGDAMWIPTEAVWLEAPPPWGLGTSS